MIAREPVSFKKTWVWCIIIALGLISAYIGFVSLVSIWIGLDHTHQAGFWIPVLVGTSFLMTIFYIFLRITRRLLRYMAAEDIVNI
ncbi:MAG: hypothetical protein JRJ86_00575 [Deltaproteobacteria bacterium]|nr:hypothetical protein [Deltaproteobacteria bacterium]MBW2343408.1 hypothetical protein [Deltaproteobacteria bacterium]